VAGETTSQRCSVAPGMHASKVTIERIIHMNTESLLNPNIEYKIH